MPGPLGLDPLIWDILACPCERHAPLTADEAAQQIVCTVCATRFRVDDGIPVMLLDEAIAGPRGVGVPLEPGPADPDQAGSGSGA